MKIALYIEDGLEQIVLTPKTDTEKSILKKITADDRVLDIKTGSFYSCQGGWIRQGFHDDRGKQHDDSTIIILREKPVPHEPIEPHAPHDVLTAGAYEDIVNEAKKIGLLYSSTTLGKEEQLKTVARAAIMLYERKMQAPPTEG